MKTLIVFFAFGLACVLGQEELNIVYTNYPTSDEFLNCLRIYKIDKELTPANIQSFNKEKKACLSACLYKDKGLLFANGSLNEELVKSSPDLSNIYSKYLNNNCKEKQGGCAVMQCIFNYQ